MKTEAPNERTLELDTWPAERIIAQIVDANEDAVRSVRSVLTDLERAAAGIEAKLRQGGRLCYAGAGTSGRLALQDAAELPPTFGFGRTHVLLAGGAGASGKAKEGAEDDREDAVRQVDAAEIGPMDVLIGIAASGATPFTVAAVERARELGAFTVGIANNPGAPLLAAADVGILLDTGPEVLAGSTRMAAGTAQKVALNALSTAVLVRLGGAYRNLMVGMAPVNEKLRRRAVSIVEQATGADAESAHLALRATDWKIREAILVIERGVSAERAAELLVEHGDRVRDALAATGSATADKPETGPDHEPDREPEPESESESDR